MYTGLLGFMTGRPRMDRLRAVRALLRAWRGAGSASWQAPAGCAAARCRPAGARPDSAAAARRPPFGPGCARAALDVHHHGRAGLRALCGQAVPAGHRVPRLRRQGLAQHHARHQGGPACRSSLRQGLTFLFTFTILLTNWLSGVASAHCHPLSARCGMHRAAAQSPCARTVGLDKGGGALDARGARAEPGPQAGLEQRGVLLGQVRPGPCRWSCPALGIGPGARPSPWRGISKLAGPAVNRLFAVRGGLCVLGRAPQAAQHPPLALHAASHARPERSHPSRPRAALRAGAAPLRGWPRARSGKVDRCRPGWASLRQPYQAEAAGTALPPARPSLPGQAAGSAAPVGRSSQLSSGCGRARAAARHGGAPEGVRIPPAGRCARLRLQGLSHKSHTATASGCCPQSLPASADEVGISAGGESAQQQQVASHGTKAEVHHDAWLVALQRRQSHALRGVPGCCRRSRSWWTWLMRRARG